MRKILERAFKYSGIKGFVIVFILSTLHSTLSFLFSWRDVWSEDEYIRAAWQPPDYVFIIVWPILYFLLAGINLYSFYSKKVKYDDKVTIFAESTIEAIAQVIWLIVFNRIIFDFDWLINKYDFQYIISTPILFGTMLYAWSVRLRTLRRVSILLTLLYLPYLCWITFASVLNIQILTTYISSR